MTGVTPGFFFSTLTRTRQHRTRTGKGTVLSRLLRGIITGHRFLNLNIYIIILNTKKYLHIYIRGPKLVETHRFDSFGPTLSVSHKNYYLNTMN